MRLLHYSSEPLALPLRTCEQVERVSEYQKPQGFWVSVEGKYDWRCWCEAESFSPGEKLVYEVLLAEPNRVLRLEWPEDIPQFTQRFGVQIKESSWPAMGIDWRKVAAQYDGIIIAPYQWEHRLSYPWYYGFDCASGCIWNPAAIASIEPIGTVVFGGETRATESPA